MKTVQSLWHRPVMPEEVLRFLQCRAGGGYIDATIGGGGHAEKILASCSPAGKLLGIDRDPESVSQARRHLQLFGNRVFIIQGLFSRLPIYMKEKNWSCADGILLDLGVSSHQLTTAARGFGFKENGDLDMRMDPGEGRSAAELLRDLPEEELARIFYELGEERHARRIARAIVQRRRAQPILTTQDLAHLVEETVPGGARRGQRIHPATRTFQALRIYINDELGELSRFLDSAPKLLCPGGRLVIISYHSLEDRLVKRSFKFWQERGNFRVITKKVVVPGEAEKRSNPRARSAKLRVLERQG